MQEEIRKSVTQVVFIILFSVVFITFTPGSVYHWYKRGTGNAYSKYIMAGVNREVAKQKAYSHGILYAATMVNGTNIPLLGLLIATTGIIRRYNSRTSKRYSRFAFLFFFVWGAVFLALAESMVSRTSQSFLEMFLVTSLIWLVIAGVLGFVILSIMLIRRIFERTEK